MHLKNKFSVCADTVQEKPKALVIKESLVYRNEYMYAVNQRLYGEKIKSFAGATDENSRRALFYAGGAMEHHSLGRKFHIELPKSSVLIKSQSSVAAWSWAKLLGGISFVSINANTCASSMYSIFEAFTAIHSGQIDEAIVIAEEWAEPLELEMFRQMGINIISSDGFCVLHFVKECDSPLAIVEDIAFRWIEESSPFGVSKEGYKAIMNICGDAEIDGIKLHASGTTTNDTAENEAVKEAYPQVKTLEYKSRIGHSQGVSTALEFAMMIDDVVKGRWLINAAGLGGFYGCAKVSL